MFAIRVLAGGALAGNPPSAHTLKTPFFPLALYQRELHRAARVEAIPYPGRHLAREDIRFVLAYPQVSAAIIGVRAPGRLTQRSPRFEPGHAAGGGLTPHGGRGGGNGIHTVRGVAGSVGCKSVSEVPEVLGEGTRYAPRVSGRGHG